MDFSIDATVRTLKDSKHCYKCGATIPAKSTVIQLLSGNRMLNKTNLHTSYLCNKCEKDNQTFMQEVEEIETYI